MKKQKYWLLTVQVTNGEYESLIRSAHEGAFNAEEYVKDFYANPDEVEEGSETYYFNGGEIACQIYSFQEIPKQDYDILKKYI